MADSCDILNVLGTVYCDAIYNKKIIKKIGILNNLNSLNIPILNYSFQEKQNILNIINKIACNTSPGNKNNTYNYNKLNTILGNVVHNALESSGFNLIISNFPEMAVSIDGTCVNQMTSENVYFSLEEVFGVGMVYNVFKISEGMYILYCSNPELVMETINNKMVGNNIITVNAIDFKDKVNDNVGVNEVILNSEVIKEVSGNVLSRLLENNSVKLEIVYNAVNFMYGGLNFIKNKVMFWK